MIKNAQEAKRIIHSYNNTADPMLIETQNVFESKGYLTALIGPEVKALVEALEDAYENLPDSEYKKILDTYYAARSAALEKGETK